MADETHKTEAARIAEIRKALPTSLGSAEIRDAIAADVRARSVFVSRGANAVFLDELKKRIDELAKGEINLPKAREMISKVLRDLGYTPEGGFPDTPPGEVPPADAGTLQDLSSRRRIDFILRTQMDLLQGQGQQLRGNAEVQIREFPAWELVRLEEREEPRDWMSRWQIVGGQLVGGGRMIALKGDPIWGELGGSGNFDDALDVDFPPFAFNSGMGWAPVTWGECKRLGITGPNGESIEEWQSKAVPILLGKQPSLPAPQLSVENLDPEVRKAFEDSAGIKIVESTATTPGNEDEVRRVLAERRAARQARSEELLRKSIDKRITDYNERSGQ